MEYKLFVGNIPFDCKTRDFKKCFQNYEGLISADLINNNLSKSNSKCFGFVVFNNKNTFNEILNDNNIYIGDRKLRLTRYFDKNNDTQNYIKLENIPITISDKDIRNEFENYSKVGKCFIDMDRKTGEYKSSGIVEILETEVFEQLLTLDVILINDAQINISRYINKIDNSEIKVKKNYLNK
jgi:RNA recognition motif-containing protein